MHNARELMSRQGKAKIKTCKDKVLFLVESVVLLELKRQVEVMCISPSYAIELLKYLPPFGFVRSQSS